MEGYLKGCANAGDFAPDFSVRGRGSNSSTMQHQQILPLSSFHGDSFAVKREESSQNKQDFQYNLVWGGTVRSPMDADVTKAKIVTHPQYSNLLLAYLDCQKVGAPPEVATQLTALGRDFESQQRSLIGCSDTETDPELDQFMEAYFNVLVKYKEELGKPLQEAMDFTRKMASELYSLSNGNIKVFSPDEKCEGVRLFEDEKEQDRRGEGGGVETDPDPGAKVRELKRELLKKYSGYLSSLEKELSKKRKKGKLPMNARQKLLSWWDLHCKWPYPSESEKVALAELTGLDQNQINNWFINQRKRHWRPYDEDMQFDLMGAFSYPF